MIYSIKKALAAFVAGVFLFNDISAYALSPESRLSDAAFRPLFQAGYTLLANEAVNEYIEKYLISRHTGKKIEWISDVDVNQFRAGGKKDITRLVERWWRNRVVIEDDGAKEADYMVVSIPGLLKNTGQTGHVGLGRWNGMPIAYMDDGYYYDQAAIEKAIKEGPGAGSARRQEAIIHEIDEIRQYEQERHDLQEVTHRDVSYDDMRRMLNQHPSVALALHGDSLTLDRLYKEIRLDLNSIDLAAIYDLYRKHGLASNTPAHPLAKADKSPRGGVNIAAGSSASDIEDTEQDYVKGQVFERLIELNRHEEDSAWKYSHMQGIKEYLSGQDRHMVAQAFYKYFDSLNQIEQYYNSNRSERITRHRVGSFVFSPNLPPKYEEDIIKAICQSFRRFYGTTGDYPYSSFDLHMASLKVEVLHLLLELEPDVIEDFLAAVERESDFGRKYALQIKSLLDYSPKKNALINTMFKRGRDDPIFAYGPTLFMTFAEDVADSVPEFDGYKIMRFDRLVDQIGEDDDRTFAALVAIDIAISKVYPSGGGIYSSVIDRVGASWAAWEKFLSGLEKVLDTSEDPFVLRTALGLYERMAGVGETKKNARLTRVCLKAVEKVSDIETRHWLLSSLIVNVSKNEDIRSQVKKIVMDKLFNFLADRTNNNITPIHITMDEWYLRNGHEKLLLDLTEIIMEPGHFAEKRKIGEDFLKLLSLLNRNWWLLEDPERGYNDKTAFEINTIRNVPDKGAVFDWSDHDFCDRSYYDSKLNIAERIINDRIPMAREGKIRPMSTEDQQEMFRLAQSLGISIADSSPTTGTPAKSVYLSANGLWKLVELSERLPSLIGSLLKRLREGLDKLFYGTTNFTNNYRITTFNALLKSGWTKDELIREIVGLSLEAYGEEEDIEAKERQGIYRNIEMHADNDEIFIAVDGSKIIGSVIAQANSEKIDVSNLVVKPEYQSERVGTRLMNSVTEWMSPRSIRLISLFAVEDEVNGVKPSVEFYDSYFARNNFKIIHRIKDKVYRPIVQNRILYLVEIPPNPVTFDDIDGNQADFTIAGNGWKDMTRRGHELFHDNLGKEMLLIWEMLKEGAIESNIPIEGYRQYTHRKGMHYPIRLLAKEIMKRTGKKEIMLNNSHGLRIKIGIDDDGVMVIINPRFNVNHAGRNEMAVYARDERGVVHEKEELMLWRDYARDPASGVVPYGIIGLPENSWMHQIGDEITEWANRMRRDGRLPEVQKTRRRFHQLACRAEFKHVLDHTPGISEEAKGLIWQKIGLRYEAAEYLMENCADMHVVSSRPGSDDGDLLFISPVEKRFVISEACLKSHSPQWIEHRIVTYNHYRKLLGNFSHLEDKLAAEIAAETLAMSVLVNKCRPDEHGRREYSARDLNSELTRITGDRSGEWRPEQELKLFKAIKERFLSGLIEENRRNELHEVPDHVIDIIRAKMAAELERLLRDEEKNKEIRVDDEIDPVIKSEREQSAAKDAIELLPSDKKILTAIKALQEREAVITNAAIAEEAGYSETTVSKRKNTNSVVRQAIEGAQALSPSDKKILAAIKSLQERETIITRTTIAEEAGLSETTLSKRKNTNSIIGQAVEDAQALLPSDQKILKAINSLQRQGAEITLPAITKETGLDKATIARRKLITPVVRQAMEAVKEEQSPSIDNRILTAIKALEGREVEITQNAIANEAGLHSSTITSRKKADKVVRKAIEDARSIPLSDKKILAAVNRLLEQKVEITRSGIVAESGLSRDMVEKREEANPYIQETIEDARRLLPSDWKIMSAIKILQDRGSEITQAAIANETGLSENTIIIRKKSNSIVRRAMQEVEPLSPDKKILAAIKTLQEKGIKITQGAIADEAGISSSTVSHYKVIYPVVKKAVLAAKHYDAGVATVGHQEIMTKSGSRYHQRLVGNHTASAPDAIMTQNEVRQSLEECLGSLSNHRRKFAEQVIDILLYEDIDRDIPLEQAIAERSGIDPWEIRIILELLRSNSDLKMHDPSDVSIEALSAESKVKNTLSRRGFLGAVIGAAVAMKLVNSASQAQAQGLNVDVSPKINESNGEWPQDIRARIANALRTLAFHRDIRYQQIDKIHRHDLDGGRMRFWVESSRDWGRLEPNFIDIIFTKEDFTRAGLKEYRIEEFEEGVLGRAYVGPERQGTSLIEYLLDALLAALVIIPTIFFSREAFKKYVRYYRIKNEREALHRQHQDDIAAAYRTAGRRGWTGRKNRRGMLSMASSDDKGGNAHKSNSPDSNQVRNEIRVLILCDNNTERSPLAAEILRTSAKTPDDLKGRLTFKSAAILGISQGTYLKKYTERDSVLALHTQHYVTPDDINEADIVFVMTRSQRKNIVKEYPQVKGRVFLLLGREDLDMGQSDYPSDEDLYLHSAKPYRSLREKIEGSSGRIFNTIRRIIARQKPKPAAPLEPTSNVSPAAPDVLVASRRSFLKGLASVIVALTATPIADILNNPALWHNSQASNEMLDFDSDGFMMIQFLRHIRSPQSFFEKILELPNKGLSLTVHDTRQWGRSLFDIFIHRFESMIDSNETNELRKHCRERLLESIRKIKEEDPSWIIFRDRVLNDPVYSNNPREDMLKSAIEWFVEDEMDNALKEPINNVMRPIAEELESLYKATQHLSDKDFRDKVIKHIAENKELPSINELRNKSINRITEVREDLRKVLSKLHRIEFIDRKIWNGERVWGVSKKEQELYDQRPVLEEKVGELRRVLHDLQSLAAFAPMNPNAARGSGQSRSADSDESATAPQSAKPEEKNRRDRHYLADHVNTKGLEKFDFDGGLFCVDKTRPWHNPNLIMLWREAVKQALAEDIGKDIADQLIVYPRGGVLYGKWQEGDLDLTFYLNDWVYGHYEETGLPYARIANRFISLAKDAGLRIIEDGYDPEIEAKPTVQNDKFNQFPVHIKNNLGNVITLDIHDGPLSLIDPLTASESGGIGFAYDPDGNYFGGARTIEVLNRYVRGLEIDDLVRVKTQDFVQTAANLEEYIANIRKASSLISGYDELLANYYRKPFVRAITLYRLIGRFDKIDETVAALDSIDGDVQAKKYADSPDLMKAIEPHYERFLQEFSEAAEGRHIDAVESEVRRRVANHAHSAPRTNGLYVRKGSVLITTFAVIFSLGAGVAAYFITGNITTAVLVPAISIAFFKLLSWLHEKILLKLNDTNLNLEKIAKERKDTLSALIEDRRISHRILNKRTKTAKGVNELQGLLTALIHELEKDDMSRFPTFESFSSAVDEIAVNLSEGVRKAGVVRLNQCKKTGRQIIQKKLARKQQAQKSSDEEKARNAIKEQVLSEGADAIGEIKELLQAAEYVEDCDRLSSDLEDILAEINSKGALFELRADIKTLKSEIEQKRQELQSAKPAEGQLPEKGFKRSNIHHYEDGHPSDLPSPAPGAPAAVWADVVSDRSFVLAETLEEKYEDALWGGDKIESILLPPKGFVNFVTLGEPSKNHRRNQVIADGGAHQCNYIVIVDLQTKKSALIHSNVSSSEVARETLVKACALMGIGTEDRSYFENNIRAVIARSPSSALSKQYAAYANRIEYAFVSACDDIGIKRAETDYNKHWRLNSVRLVVDEGWLLAVDAAGRKILHAINVYQSSGYKVESGAILKKNPGTLPKSGSETQASTKLRAYPMAVQYKLHPIKFSLDELSFLDRHMKQWEWLSGHFISAMVRKARITGEKKICILSLGSSTGEELARAFHEIVTALIKLGERAEEWEIRLDGIEHNEIVASEMERRIKGESPFAYNEWDDYTYAVWNTLNKYSDKFRNSACVHVMDVYNPDIFEMFAPDLVLANSVLHFANNSPEKYAFISLLDGQWVNVWVASNNSDVTGMGNKQHEILNVPLGQVDIRDNSAYNTLHFVIPKEMDDGSGGYSGPAGSPAMNVDAMVEEVLEDDPRASPEKVAAWMRERWGAVVEVAYPGPALTRAVVSVMAKQESPGALSKSSSDVSAEGTGLGLPSEPSLELHSGDPKKISRGEELRAPAKAPAGAAMNKEILNLLQKSKKSRADWVVILTFFVSKLLRGMRPTNKNVASMFDGSLTARGIKDILRVHSIDYEEVGMVRSSYRNGNISTPNGIMIPEEAADRIISLAVSMIKGAYIRKVGSSNKAFTIINVDLLSKAMNKRLKVPVDPDDLRRLLDTEKLDENLEKYGLECVWVNRMHTRLSILSSEGDVNISWQNGQNGDVSKRDTLATPAEGAVAKPEVEPGASLKGDTPVALDVSKPVAEMYTPAIPMPTVTTNADGGVTFTAKAGATGRPTADEYDLRAIRQQPGGEPYFASGHLKKGVSHDDASADLPDNASKKTLLKFKVEGNFTYIQKADIVDKISAVITRKIEQYRQGLDHRDLGNLLWFVSENVTQHGIDREGRLRIWVCVMSIGSEIVVQIDNNFYGEKPFPPSLANKVFTPSDKPFRVPIDERNRKMGEHGKGIKISLIIFDRLGKGMDPCPTAKWIVTDRDDQSQRVRFELRIPYEKEWTEGENKGAQTRTLSESSSEVSLRAPEGEGASSLAMMGVQDTVFFAEPFSNPHPYKSEIADILSSSNPLQRAYLSVVYSEGNKALPGFWEFDAANLRELPGELGNGMLVPEARLSGLGFESWNTLDLLHNLPPYEPPAFGAGHVTGGDGADMASTAMLQNDHKIPAAVGSAENIVSSATTAQDEGVVETGLLNVVRTDAVPGDVAYIDNIPIERMDSHQTLSVDTSIPVYTRDVNSNHKIYDPADSAKPRSAEPAEDAAVAAKPVAETYTAAFMPASAITVNTNGGATLAPVTGRPTTDKHDLRAIRQQPGGEPHFASGMPDDPVKGVPVSGSTGERVKTKTTIPDIVGVAEDRTEARKIRTDLDGLLNKVITFCNYYKDEANLLDQYHAFHDPAENYVTSARDILADAINLQEKYPDEHFNQLAELAKTIHEQLIKQRILFEKNEHYHRLLNSHQHASISVLDLIEASIMSGEFNNATKDVIESCYQDMMQGFVHLCGIDISIMYNMSLDAGTVTKSDMDKFRLALNIEKVKINAIAKGYQGDDKVSSIAQLREELHGLYRVANNYLCHSMQVHLDIMLEYFKSARENKIENSGTLPKSSSDVFAEGTDLGLPAEPSLKSDVKGEPKIHYYTPLLEDPKLPDEPELKGLSSARMAEKYSFYITRLIWTIAGLSDKKVITRLSKTVIEEEPLAGWICHFSLNQVAAIQASLAAYKFDSNVSNLRRARKSIEVFKGVLDFYERIAYSDFKNEAKKAFWRGTKKSPVPYQLMYRYYIKRVFVTDKKAARNRKIFTNCVEKMKTAVDKMEEACEEAIKEARVSPKPLLKPFGPKAATSDGNPEKNRIEALEKQRDIADAARIMNEEVGPAGQPASEIIPRAVLKQALRIYWNKKRTRQFKDADLSMRVRLANSALNIKRDDGVVTPYLRLSFHMSTSLHGDPTVIELWERLKADMPRLRWLIDNASVIKALRSNEVLKSELDRDCDGVPLIEALLNPDFGYKKSSWTLPKSSRDVPTEAAPSVPIGSETVSGVTEGAGLSSETEMPLDSTAAEVEEFVDSINASLQYALLFGTRAQICDEGGPTENIFIYPFVCTQATKIAKKLINEKFGDRIKAEVVYAQCSNPAAYLPYADASSLIHTWLEITTPQNRRYYVSFADGQFRDGYQGRRGADKTHIGEDGSVQNIIATRPAYIGWYLGQKRDFVTFRDITDDSDCRILKSELQLEEIARGDIAEKAIGDERIDEVMRLFNMAMANPGFAETMLREGVDLRLQAEPSPEPMQGAKAAGDKTALNYIFDESLAKKLAGELANDLKPFLEQMRTALYNLNKEKDAKLQKKHFDEIRKAAMNIINHARAMPGSDGKKDKTNDILRDSVQSGGAASDFDFANTLSPIVSIGGMSVNLGDWMDDIKEGVEKSEQISGLITAYANSGKPTVFIKGINGEVYIDFRASAPQSAETAEDAAAATKPVAETYTAPSMPKSAVTVNVDSGATFAPVKADRTPADGHILRQLKEHGQPHFASDGVAPAEPSPERVLSTRLRAEPYPTGEAILPTTAVPTAATAQNEPPVEPQLTTLKPATRLDLLISKACERAQGGILAKAFQGKGRLLMRAAKMSVSAILTMEPPERESYIYPLMAIIDRLRRVPSEYWSDYDRIVYNIYSELTIFAKRRGFMITSAAGMISFLLKMPIHSIFTPAPDDMGPFQSRVAKTLWNLGMYREAKATEAVYRAHKQGTIKVLGGLPNAESIAGFAADISEASIVQNAAGLPGFHRHLNKPLKPEDIGYQLTSDGAYYIADEHGSFGLGMPKGAFGHIVEVLANYEAQAMAVSPDRSAADIAKNILHLEGQYLASLRPYEADPNPVARKIFGNIGDMYSQVNKDVLGLIRQLASSGQADLAYQLAIEAQGSTYGSLADFAKEVIGKFEGNVVPPNSDIPQGAARSEIPAQMPAVDSDTVVETPTPVVQSALPSSEEGVRPLLRGRSDGRGQTPGGTETVPPAPSVPIGSETVSDIQPESPQGAAAGVGDGITTARDVIRKLIASLPDGDIYSNDLLSFASHLDRIGVRPGMNFVDIGPGVNSTAGIVLAAYGCNVDVVEPEPDRLDFYRRILEEKFRQFYKEDEASLKGALSRVNFIPALFSDYAKHRLLKKYDGVVAINVFDIMIVHHSWEDIECLWPSLADQAVMILAMAGNEMDAFRQSGEKAGFDFTVERTIEYYENLAGYGRGPNYTVFLKRSNGSISQGTVSSQPASGAAVRVAPNGPSLNDPAAAVTLNADGGVTFAPIAGWTPPDKDDLRAIEQQPGGEPHFASGGEAKPLSDHAVVSEFLGYMSTVEPGIGKLLSGLDNDSPNPETLVALKRMSDEIYNHPMRLYGDAGNVIKTRIAHIDFYSSKSCFNVENLKLSWQGLFIEIDNLRHIVESGNLDHVEECVEPNAHFSDTMHDVRRMTPNQSLRSGSGQAHNESARAVLMAIRDGTEAGGLLDQALSEGVAINAAAAKMLEALGIVERVDGISTAAVNGSERHATAAVIARYVLTGMMRGRNDEQEETRNLINVVCDARVKMDEEECWLGRKGLSKSETLIAGEIILSHVVDHIATHVKESELVQKVRTINIWDGYANKQAQKAVLQEVERLTEKGPYIVKFCDIEELVSIVESPDNVGGAVVTILPLDARTEGLKSAAGRVIFVNPATKDFVYELGQIEGLIGIGRAYLNDDEDSFNRLYRLLAVNPQSGIVPLSELKSDPKKLQFILKSIAPHDYKEHRTINDRLTCLLRHA